MSSANTHTDLTGRIVAFLVFLVGIGLLCLVFDQAWSLFRSPVPGLELPVKAGGTAPPAAGIGIALTAFVRQVILLALMTVAGSLIAGKGVHLYYSAAHHATTRDAPAKNGRNGRAPASAPENTTEVPAQKPQS